MASQGDQPAETHLADESVDSLLAPGERPVCVLTNRRVGVSRASADDVLRVEPAADRGAVAAITEDAVHFAVGDPSGYDGDFTATVRRHDIVTVERRTDSLAQALFVKTAAGAGWEFTVREGDLDDAVDELATGVADRLLREAQSYREEAAAADDEPARLDALDAALEAFQQAASLSVNVDDQFSEGSVREAAVAVIEELIDVTCTVARDRRARGNWDAQAGKAERAVEHFAAAQAHFDRALELAESYPPGDPAAIESERASLGELLAEYGLTDETSTALAER
jgi:tetratricopeptide (TPR) repeat protein